ncbi:hypothetical protein NGB36_09220 [Streptomyces sp. RB6PN25]|uniref:Transposase n=1 Tax=Streptomyces humicola TaxID=2953240 RepID=A0ABT1PSY0_9ACTN|nr:hypothetical protein [Streptomyces humicola]MCQ4080777.1 hypothetical protein [Streptomyces humicola]
MVTVSGRRSGRLSVVGLIAMRPGSRTQSTPTPTGGLVDLLGCDPADTDTLAVDGKSARGSRHDDAPAAHLLAALIDAGHVVTRKRSLKPVPRSASDYFVGGATSGALGDVQ